MPHFVEVDGQFKRVTASWVGVGGAWKRVLGRHVGVGEEWKLKFVAGRVQLQFASVRGYATNPDVPEARVTYNPDGTAVGTFTDQTYAVSENLTPWHDPVTPGAGSSFEIRHVPLAGDPGFIQGSPVNQWLSLGQAQSWFILGRRNEEYLNRSQAYAWYTEIRPAGGGPIIARSQMGLMVVVYDPNHPTGGGGGGGGINQPRPPQFLQ